MAKQAMQLIDTRQYRYWQALYLACFSRRLYIDVAKRWKGIGFIYGLLVLSFLVLPLSIQSMWKFNQYAYADYMEPFTRIPVMTIHHGRAAFDVTMPYFIKNKAGKIFIIVDTTGSISTFKPEYPDLIALITAEAGYFHQPKYHFLTNKPNGDQFLQDVPIEKFSFSKLHDGQFDMANWFKSSGLNSMKNAMVVAVYPFILCVFFGLMLTLLLTLALIGQLTSYTLFRHKLSFMRCCRLMMVTSTLSLYIFFTCKTLGYQTTPITVGCILLAYAYFCFAVLVVKRDSRQVVLRTI